MPLLPRPPRLRPSLPAVAVVVAVVALAASGCLGGAEPLDPELVVVAYGDSYTSGTGAEPSEAYPARLAASLGVRVIDEGVHGETAFEGLARIDDVLRHDPDLVVVEFGVNEAYRGHPVSHAAAGLEAILRELDAAGVPAVLVGVHFWTYQENFDAALRGLGERHDAPVVYDVLRGILDDPDLRSDEYHPNADGYALMEERVRPVVRERLAALELR